MVPVMKRKARMTHSQDNASRSMSLFTSGFVSVATGSVSSAFIRHHLNFHDWCFFGLHRAGFELALRAVHGVHTRVARRTERSARIVHSAPQILQREEAQRVRAQILADFLDRALGAAGMEFWRRRRLAGGFSSPCDLQTRGRDARAAPELARIEQRFKCFELVCREPRAHPRF